MQPELMSHSVNHVYLIPEMDMRTLSNGRQPIQRTEAEACIDESCAADRAAREEQTVVSSRLRRQAQTHKHP
jgi:hypothetical protein